MAEQPERASVEKLYETGEEGRKLSSRARQSQRSIEHYLAGGMRPRWMQRIIEIDRGIAEHRRELERSYRSIREEHGHDSEVFADRWRARVAAWRFEELNTLIGQHNEYYPIERDLPMNPRTGEYVNVGGRPYLREPLTVEWALAEFPPITPG